ncbi:hypothetical protein QFC21_004211 [Naganishia friedmannii]|uniref:Uncharacterized protein n=1 Tax=Naganishia friedmannii TaxID=89922 RepID=A0ACC2VKC2_9TREE|nr:hypothetical protein QFC21_004211 [Naganishia friedmannii]
MARTGQRKTPPPQIGFVLVFACHKKSTPVNHNMSHEQVKMQDLSRPGATSPTLRPTPPTFQRTVKADPWMGSSGRDPKAASINVTNFSEETGLLEGTVEDRTTKPGSSVSRFLHRRAQSPKKPKRPRPPSSSNQDQIVRNLSDMGFPGLSNLSSGHN